MKQDAERLILPLADDAGRPSGIIGMTLYYLAAQPRIDDPQAVEGVAIFYNCAGLPAEPPDSQPGWPLRPIVAVPRGTAAAPAWWQTTLRPIRR